MNNLLKWLYLFTLIYLKIFIRFFTLWGFVISGLYYTGIISKYQQSVLFILIMISFFGLIITYVNPKKIVIPYFNIVLKGKLLQVLDILGHHLPLIVFLLKYNSKIKPDNLLFFAVITITYLLFINPFRTYCFKCLQNNS